MHTGFSFGCHRTARSHKPEALTSPFRGGCLRFSRGVVSGFALHTNLSPATTTSERAHNPGGMVAQNGDLSKNTLQLVENAELLQT
jgi:hypothetical protein